VAAKDVVLPIGSQTRLQFRFEVFNLLNRSNFRLNNNNVNVSHAAFGILTETYDARQIQLGLELSF